MDKKTASIVSYITIIGWLIAYFGSNDQKPRPALLVYHLKQNFGLFILSIVYSILIQIIGYAVPAIAMILSITSFIFLAFMIIGAITASKEEEKPLPLIGKMFENKFDFIK